MKELIGSVIKSVDLDDEQHFMRFVTDRGTFVYRVWGACCSEAWFADIVGFYSLIGRKVIFAENIEIPEGPEDGRCRQEQDLFYGVKLTTTGGYCDIVYRNSCLMSYDAYMDLVPEGYRELGSLVIDGLTWVPVTGDYPC